MMKNNNFGSFIKTKEYTSKRSGVGDCFLRALTIITGKPYQSVRKNVNTLKKELYEEFFKDSRFGNAFFLCSCYLTNNEDFEVLDGDAISSETFDDWMLSGRKCRRKRKTVKRLALDYPKGRYLVLIKKHATVIIDGIIYDRWDTRRFKIEQAWRYKKGGFENEKE